ncbi:MAG: hypothetical protein OWV35_06735 [Firmicutes bacterium]|nr:hypothetical protein [Bacillota bacterium]
MTWTPAGERRLLRARAEGQSWAAIAWQLGRRVAAVRKRVERLQDGRMAYRAGPGDRPHREEAEEHPGERPHGA